MAPQPPGIEITKSNSDGRRQLNLFRRMSRRRTLRVQLEDLQPNRVEPLLSVVMPVYNTETFLPQAVQSVLDQSYRTLELILVDDGSTDQSGSICDEYAAADSRVRVIHKENAGLGAARNSGVDCARGEFLAFVDSDDFLLPEAYGLMVNSLRRSRSNFVTGNVQRRQGQRRWQAWNQSRSHAKSQIGIRIGDNPELIWDSIAVNKVFRRSFWTEHVGQFPEGVLYEDLVPMSRAFLSADSIDVFSKPVYVWRSRDKGDSISQRRIELVNLTDRLKTVEQIHRMIIEAGEDARLLNVFYEKILSNDIGTYVHLIDEAEPTFIELVEDAASKYWDRVAPEVRGRLPVERKILLHLLSQHSSSEAIEFKTWFADLRNGLPTSIQDGRIRLDQSRIPSLPHIEHDWLLSLDDEAVARATITDLQWSDSSALTVSGYAYIPLVSDGSQTIELVATNIADAEAVVFSSEHAASSDAARWASDVSQPHQNDGFVCAIDPMSLVRRDLDGDPMDSMWEFRVRVTHQGLERTTPANNIWRGGTAGVIPATVFPNGLRAIPRTDAGRPLRLEFKSNGVSASRVSVEGNHVSIGFGKPHLTEIQGLKFRDAENGLTVTAHTESNTTEQTFVANLPIGDASKTTWQVIARTNGRNLPVLSDESARTQQHTSDGSLIAESDRRGRTIITGRDRSALAEFLELTPDSTLKMSGTLFGTGPFEFGLARDGGSPVEWIPARTSLGKFTTEISLTRSDSNGMERSFPSGRFTILARQMAASTSGHPAYLVLANSVVSVLPMHHELPLFHAQLDRVGDGAIRIEISAPIPTEDLGAFAQKEIKRGFAKTFSEPNDSVFCDMNEPNITERTTEVIRELATLDVSRTWYWSVDDMSESLAPTVVPVLRGSRAWAEKLAQSKYVIHNTDLASYRAPSHQSRLVWRGTESLGGLSKLFPAVL